MSVSTVVPGRDKIRPESLQKSKGTTWLYHTMTSALGLEMALSWTSSALQSLTSQHAEGYCVVLQKGSENEKQGNWKIV